MKIYGSKPLVRSGQSGIVTRDNRFAPLPVENKTYLTHIGRKKAARKVLRQGRFSTAFSKDKGLYSIPRPVSRERGARCSGRYIHISRTSIDSPGDGFINRARSRSVVTRLPAHTFSRLTFIAGLSTMSIMRPARTSPLHPPRPDFRAFPAPGAACNTTGRT